MDIKIGFTQNPRELVIRARDSRDEIIAELTEGLRAGSGFIELTDAKEHTYFLNASEVAYVEVGNDNRPAVGFGGV